MAISTIPFFCSASSASTDKRQVPLRKGCPRMKESSTPPGPRNHNLKTYFSLDETIGLESPQQLGLRTMIRLPKGHRQLPRARRLFATGLTCYEEIVALSLLLNRLSYAFRYPHEASDPNILHYPLGRRINFDLCNLPRPQTELGGLRV